MKYKEKSVEIYKYRLSIYQEPDYFQVGVTFHPGELGEGWLFNIKIIFWSFEIERIIPPPVVEHINDKLKIQDSK